MTTSNEDKPAPRRIDLRQEGVHWDLGESQSYGEYLQLDKVLNAQKPNSIEQDEMLFIIVHQVSELWMRLFLHELGAVFECVRRDNLDPSFKMLARISRLQEELLGAWSVLSTLTPFEYSAFRNTLGRSSGFQSVQYRLLEYMLGNKNRDYIAVHKRDPAACERLERALQAPSIYDEVLRLLSRRGYGIPEEIVERDFSEPYEPSKAVTAAWLAGCFVITPTVFYWRKPGILAPQDSSDGWALAGCLVLMGMFLVGFIGFLIRAIPRRHMRLLLFEEGFVSFRPDRVFACRFDDVEWTKESFIEPECKSLCTLTVHLRSGMNGCWSGTSRCWKTRGGW